MTNYTDEQMDRIIQMPAAILSEAILAGGGRPVISMRAFLVGEKLVSEAGSLYPCNVLILEMIKNVNLPKLEEAVKHIFLLGDRNAMRAECQRKIGAGLVVLAQDEEANQFKAFLMAIAEKVVNAAAEGLFGKQGIRASAYEDAYLHQLEQRLGIASAA
jgi:hypothetical protein